MDYFLTFLEGIISFISPCCLPLLPLYISYLTGSENVSGFKRMLRACGFVAGFTLVFCLFGTFAGAVGRLLIKYRTAVNIVCGMVIILFGLSYLDIIKFKFLKGVTSQHKVNSFLSAFIFGIIYSVNLTPCVGAFLGSAIMLAAGSGTVMKGNLLLLTYSLGMGIPFLLSAAVIDRLAGAFDAVKKHYKTINLVCGLFLIVTGVLLATGILGKLIAIVR